MNPITRKILIAAGILVACGIVLSTIAVAMGGLDQKRSGNSMNYKEKTYTYSAAMLKSVDVSDVSSDVIIKGGSENEVKIICYESENDYYNTDYSSDGRLTVSRVVNKNWFDIFASTITRKNTLTIYLPSSISGDLKASSVSGIVSLSNVDVGGSLRTSTTSGSIRISSASAKGRGQISSVSGGMTIENVNFDALVLNSTSGSIKLSGANLLGNLSVTNTSGYIELDSVTSGDVSAASISGGIRLNAVKGSNFNLKTTSGSVTGFIIGSPADYTVEASSTSGKLHLPRSQGGAKILRASSVSGSIDLDIK